MKKYLRVITICVFCGAIFLSTAYFYLLVSVENRQKTVSESAQNVPYSSPPQNTGLLFCLPEDVKITIFLDFERQVSYIIYMQQNYSNLGNYTAYPADYEFEIDYDLLSVLIDRLGGVDLKTGNEVLRYTGIGVCDIISGGASDDLRAEIMKSICNRLSKKGFSNDDFAFLIANSGSKLQLPDCMLWQDYLRGVFGNPVFINWEN